MFARRSSTAAARDRKSPSLTTTRNFRERRPGAQLARERERERDGEDRGWRNFIFDINAANAYAYACAAYISANICACATRLNKRPPPADDRPQDSLSLSLVLAVRSLCLRSIILLSSLPPTRSAFSLLLFSPCPLRVGLLINPFVCPQVGIPESRDPTCAGSMPGHTHTHWCIFHGLQIQTSFVRKCGSRRNCIFLHRTRFFSRHFVSPQNVRATLEVKTPPSRRHRALSRPFGGLSSTNYIRAGSSRIPSPLKDVTFCRDTPSRRYVNSIISRRSLRRRGACSICKRTLLHGKN